MSQTALVAVTDAHFAWMLGGSPASFAGLQLPPGGVDDPAILTHVRALVEELHFFGCRAAWMIVSGNEVVGLISYKTPPLAGEAEIGYGIARERRRRGHASRALAAVVAYACADAATSALTAETHVGNVFSQAVLARNGFERIDRRVDANGDDVFFWRHLLRG